MPLYIEVEDGNAFSVRLTGTAADRAKVCGAVPPFLADEADFSAENMEKCGSGRKTGLKTASWKRVWIRW